VLPLLGNSSAIQLIEKIVASLVAIIPLIVKEAQELVPIVKNIITALKADPSTTAEQVAVLDAMSKRLDQEFEDAAAAALKEDAGG
jgi:ethanolamine transporter EutH